MKDLVCQNEIQNAEQLWQLILNAADIIRETPNMCHQVQNNLLIHVRKSVKVDGRIFEHFFVKH